MATVSNSSYSTLSKSLKFLLEQSHASCDVAEYNQLSRCIIQSSEELLQHDPEFDIFYSLYVGLASHHVGTSISQLGMKDVCLALDAARVLLRCLLDMLAMIDYSCAVSQKNLSILLQCLCSGVGGLSKADLLLYTALLKSSKTPDHIRQDTAGEKPEANLDGRDLKRPRLDTGCDIFDQLTSIFSTSLVHLESESDGADIFSADDAKSSSAQHPDVVLSTYRKKMASVMLEIGARDQILEVCYQLPFVNRYIHRCHESLQTMAVPHFPATLLEALTTRSSYMSLLNDMSIVHRLLSLPILEPLPSHQQQEVTALMISCLYAALCVAISNTIYSLASCIPTKISSSSKEEEMDNVGANIVKRALDIYQLVSSATKNSTSNSGNKMETTNMVVTLFLLRGLQHGAGLTTTNIVERKDSSKTRSHSLPTTQPRAKDSTQPAKSAPMKTSHGFDLLSVALASHALKLLTALFDHISMDTVYIDKDNKTDVEKTGSVEYVLSGIYTSKQRLDFITQNVDIISLSLIVITDSFKKASQICRQKQGPEVSESSATSSDSNTYYEDDFSSSQDSSDDDDEPLLGEWIKEALSPFKSPDTRSPIPMIDDDDGDAPFGGKRGVQYSGEETSSLVPDKMQHECFVALSTSTVVFINSYFIGSEHPHLRELFRTSFCDDHIVSLASFIRDLDKESNRPNTDGIYDKLLAAVSTLTHNLIANFHLSPPNQHLLLDALGLHPDSTLPWPLTVYPRCLAVLTEMLTLKQQTERAAKLLKSDSEAQIVAIWMRFIDSLKSAAMSGDVRLETFEDVNVEHMQVLLFIFHSLPLLQKKTVLLRLGQTLVDISYLDHGSLVTITVLPLTRLILILEYMLKYFYDPPSLLLDQVKWNLFGVHSLTISTATKHHRCHFYACNEVEVSYRRVITPKQANEVGALHPRFYNVGPSDTNSQDSPKIDGLAASFLQATEQVLDYNELYDACIKLLIAGTHRDKSPKPDMSLLDASSLHYHLLITWRLLASLPPSAAYLQLLGSGRPNEAPWMLHALRWVPRLGHKAFVSWTKDNLVKQGESVNDASILIASAVKTAHSIQYDCTSAMRYLQQQVAKLPVIGRNEVLARCDLPSFMEIYTLDAIVSKTQISLDSESLAKSLSEVDQQTISHAQDLLPAILALIEAYATFLRSSILSEIDQTNAQPTIHQLKAYNSALAIGSTRTSKLPVLGSCVMASLPPSVRNTIEKYNEACVANEFPGPWKTTSFPTDIIPGETYLDAIHHAHLATLSGQVKFTINMSLRHCLQTLVTFASDLIQWCRVPEATKDFIRVTFPLISDITMDFINDTVTAALEKYLGAVDGDSFSEKAYLHMISMCHELITQYSGEDSGLDEKLLQDCFQYLETRLEKPAAKNALDKFYAESADLCSLFLSAASDNLSLAFTTKALKFFNTLLQLDEKTGEQSYDQLCGRLNDLSSADPLVLRSWLAKIVVPKPEQTDSEKAIADENLQLLKTFTSHIVKDKSKVNESVALTLLRVLIPMGAQILEEKLNANGFSKLFLILRTLAGSGMGQGHTLLFEAANGWLRICKDFLSQKDVLDKVFCTEKGGKHDMMIDAICYLLAYIGEILSAVKQVTRKSDHLSMLYDPDPMQSPDPDSDWPDDLAKDDDDSGGEDSDEESLNAKLCTFTITQKEFMNQHWYHCHTCKMVDGVGVCTVCAKVCHKDHDLTYAKFGSFFCDCGAKEDKTCLALAKRTSLSAVANVQVNAGTSAGSYNADSGLTSSLRRRLSSSGIADKSEDKKMLEVMSKFHDILGKQLQSYKQDFLFVMKCKNTMALVVELLQFIMPHLSDMYRNKAFEGSIQCAQKALSDLHTLTKTIETTDQLMTVTLGSQEGAFENVRLSFSGNQGQTIRHLITAHMLRRVAMCVLMSPHGKRQHLAVSHEKGKITILQLSSLLKQADSSKKKLTLTRLASAPVPFTVLYIAGNAHNEDLLAVCGLKDCHILSFTNSGNVSSHIMLHPSLSSGNFIIKAIWLPGSQTEIAIITADFVKIYDLASDTISPKFYFLLPSGKIRDATFLFTEQQRSIVLMSDVGYIYTQYLDDTAMAENGPFYITNVLEVSHPSLKEAAGLIAGGGVSVYYSHTLQLLCFSYTQGKSFIAVVADDFSSCNQLFTINAKGSMFVNNGQPLVQWAEIHGHPGLVYCVTQTSNNPVVIFIKPASIEIQEIKITPSKAKIQDVIALQHSATHSDQPRTTMIVLCEDGSLRIYMANPNKTSHWLSPSVQPQGPLAISRPQKKKKQRKANRSSGVTFSVDYFESCQQSNDIEFGGSDVLEIYNVQQLKTRLNTTGMYIACTKAEGFTIEIANNNAGTVIVGIRVLVGTQSLDRAPSFLEIFGRKIPVHLTRARWYDLPFTHEESIKADNKVNLFAGGVKRDPDGIVMIDSIKVYVRTKEAFGWPDQTDEIADITVPTAVKALPPPPQIVESQPDVAVPSSVHPVDRLVSNTLEMLDGAFACDLAGGAADLKKDALDIATGLLQLPAPPVVQRHTLSLLASLFNNQAMFLHHKDSTQMQQVLELLGGAEVEVEEYERGVTMARAVALHRPANLIKCTEKSLPLTPEEPDVPSKAFKPVIKEGTSAFITRIMSLFWSLHQARPTNKFIAPIGSPDIRHIEVIVATLVDILHAYTVYDLGYVPFVCEHYIKLLLSEDTTVSFASKQAMIRCLRPKYRRRRVFIPSPQRCSSPGVGEEDQYDAVQSSAVEVEEDMEMDAGMFSELPEDMDIDSPANRTFDVDENEENMATANEQLSQGMPANPLQALADMVDLPADDEAMVELAIALSLQEQGSPSPLSFQALASQDQVDVMLDSGQLSDTTASAPGSDDEVGSNIATDGSTLRTSPADHGGSAGSESGGSAVDSVSVSGRSSAYGDGEKEVPTGQASDGSSMGGMQSGSTQPDVDMGDTDYDASVRLHALRMCLLETLCRHVANMQDVGGLRAVPVMQVLLMLISDIDGDEEKDRNALTTVITTLLKLLDLTDSDMANIATRSNVNDTRLVVLRLFSVLLSRGKSSSKMYGESSFLSTTVASNLVSSGIAHSCLVILQSLLTHWKNRSSTDDDPSASPQGLLKPCPTSSPPDMSPFFLRQYVKGHMNDVFEEYQQLLTEICLRLPNQIKKIADGGMATSNIQFHNSYVSVLADYMMTSQTPFVKRQVRKLLLSICGSKLRYRQLRDIYSLNMHLDAIRAICVPLAKESESDVFPVQTASLPYDTLISLIEHLKACTDIASARPFNWQQYCQKEEDLLPFLVKISVHLDEGLAPVVLQLLQYALCEGQATTSVSQTTTSSESPSKSKKDKDKSEEYPESHAYDTALGVELTQQLGINLHKDVLVKFIESYLLESNSTQIRWQAHSLILQVFQKSRPRQQDALLQLMWSLWPDLPKYGRKAPQFVDLIGYFTLKMPAESAHHTQDFVHAAIQVLVNQNELLSLHPNATIYNMLQGLVDFDGYYLESNPCLVCNNPEVNFSNLKLTYVKVDSKFTTTTQIVKLVGSHVVSKISLRISDLKRSKMVKTLNIYYNNRPVQAVVELKNKPGQWNKARKVTLSSGQTDVKVEFPIPIVACNLLIEFADFYDSVHATAETLQCPRCSAAVPASPGVCGNCGENVFQCHKCRSINYDEKDPFLCNACGFCKYAKFEFTLHAKPCCAVDSIHSEEDRKKAISTINSLLERADRIYKQMQLQRPTLEGLLVQVMEHSFDKMQDDQIPAVSGSNVNKAIQLLSQKYCGEAKSSFDELSKIIQKVLACRKELLDYNRQQQEAAAASTQSITSSIGSMSDLFTDDSDGLGDPHARPMREGESGGCYGCVSVCVRHCITLLRGLATDPELRQILCSQGMIRGLIDYNLHHGSVQVRADVRSLLCLLTKDNKKATDEMNSILQDRVGACLKSYMANPDLTTIASSLRYEMQLLAESLVKQDSCWEQRVRCVMMLFLKSMEVKNPLVYENIALPCLKILKSIIKPDLPTSSTKKVKPSLQESHQQPSPPSQNYSNVPGELHATVQNWLTGDPKYSFSAWKKRMPTPGATPEAVTKDTSRERVRTLYLSEKYGYRWLGRMWPTQAVPLALSRNSWLRHALFSLSSRSSRQTACSVIEAMCQVPSRKREVIDLLTSYLDDIGTKGECAAEFLVLYKRLIAPIHWKYYLSLKGLLLHLGDLITQEVEHLLYLEKSTLTSDLAQGYALKALTGLLATLLDPDMIKRKYKTKMVGSILNGYLSLRKLVVQRTKLVDETQEKMLELLEDLTTGNEKETKEFMSVCIQTVKKYPQTDYISPVFIFERLCSIIYPEENDIGEFFMILEKDPQQEDFLQGRMLGNPYSSNDEALGPLMRDVKNKICQDCELVALLEDDTGMELLVNKKIISLDLPVKEVYKRVWAADHGEGEPMPIIYRMRGLLGDATEDMINTIDSSKDEEEDKETVYKMAAVLSECGGLEVMLHRLAAIRDLVLGKQLMCVLLKLFRYALNVQTNRQALIKHKLNAIAIMLRALNIALLAEQESGSSISVNNQGQTITEQLLELMEGVLLEASHQPPEEYKQFSEHFCDKDQLNMLLDRINSPFVRSNHDVLQVLMRLIPFLAFGDETRMLTLINHFKPYLNFTKFDREHTQDEEVHLDCFCVIASGIKHNANGERLKNMMVESEIVKVAVDYIMTSAPTVKTLLATDVDNWREFVGKPSLPYVLRLLTGLCKQHPPTQKLAGDCLVPVLHKLEQVSSDGHVGTLSENLLETLKEHKDVKAKIEDIRQMTKSEKKRLAMAVRKKQLGALGMTTNEKGQVTVSSTVLKQMDDIKEETGLTCCICREGYRNQPQKVLAIYTFTRRVNLDDHENKLRKSQGYSTVSHFNLVHVDCHLAAVRHAHGREEWESAALQNANTRCNGLLPLWGPNVQESAYAACLARHNTYLQECTGVRDSSNMYTIHDIKHLLLKFAADKSFSEHSGGGGKQSNVYFFPYLIHNALYVINTTRSLAREEKNIKAFLDFSTERSIESCYESEGALYWATVAIHIFSPAQWRDTRVALLKHLLILTHVRAVSTEPVKVVKDVVVKEYGVYKTVLIFFALIDGIYNILFKKVKVRDDVPWPQSLADFIRNNDRGLMEAGDKLVSMIEEEVFPCESFAEFCDVMGLLREIPNPDEFLALTLSSLA